MAAQTVARRRMVRGRSRSRVGGLRGALVVSAGVAAVAVAVVAMVGRNASAPAGAQIAAFQAAVHDPIQHWGRIEVEGMRPAIADLRQGSDLPPEAIAGEARAWQSGLEQIRGQLKAVAVPGSLAHSMSLFQQALSDYVQTAKLVEMATGVEGSARAGLLDQAVRSAQSGDCAYDDASVALQQARHDAGLSPTIDFPNHPCSGGVAQ